jgi:polyhydroxyalkanoate synthesis repressor PhaR
MKQSWVGSPRSRSAKDVARDAEQDSRPVIIKKYANRRLYNTDTSTYVTLEDLAEMVRSERDFVVYDAKTGEDLTHSVLTQIIVEQESRGTNLLPIGFLRQLIRFYGDSMQKLVPSYLEGNGEQPAAGETKPANSKPAEDEIATLKAELSAMQQRLEQLSRR